MARVSKVLIWALIVCAFSVQALARTPCRGGINRERCEAFDLANALRTPLSVDDSKLQTRISISVAEQTAETIQGMIQELTKVQKIAKWSLGGAVLSKFLPSVQIPELKDLEKGVQSRVDAFKGAVSGLEGAVGSVSFDKPEQVAQAVEQTAVVANPVGAVEEQEAKERKKAFIQQSMLDLTARVLFYKSELQKLKQADTDAANSKSSNDTVGSMEVTVRMKDANNRIRALLEKIEAARLELTAIQNLQSADMLPEKTNVKEEH